MGSLERGSVSFMRVSPFPGDADEWRSCMGSHGVDILVEKIVDEGNRKGHREYSAIRHVAFLRTIP